MKNVLSLEQMLQFKGAIAKGVSALTLPINIDGKVQYVTAKSVTEYVAGFFSGLENGEVLIESNEPKVGVRSIKGNLLASRKHQLVTELRVLTDTTLAAETEAALIAAPFASNAPVQFKNGEVRIHQTQELFRSSGTDCTNFKASTGNDADFRGIAPFVLRPDTPWSVNFKLAGAATANHAYKFEYRAIEFTVSDKA